MDKQMKKKGFSLIWVIPVGICSLLLAIYLTAFCTAAREQARTVVENNIADDVSYAALGIGKEIEGVQKGVKAGAAYLSGVVQPDYESVLFSVSYMSGIYNAYFVNDEGIGMTASGGAMDFKELPYYANATVGSSVLFLSDEKIRGVPAILFSEPVTTMSGEKGFLFCYYAVGDLKECIDKAKFDASAFFMLVDYSGTVMMGSSSIKSAFYTASGDYNECLRNAGVSMSGLPWNGTKRISGHRYVKNAEEQRCIFYTPVPGQSYYLIMGMNTRNMNTAINKQFGMNRDAATWTGVLLALIILSFVTVNVIDYVNDKKQTKSLESKAETDLLTGLYNKIATEAKIRAYMAQHPEQQCMMFVLDIDNFKKINDTRGHAFGDEVLRTFGKQIGLEFRASDIIGRTGGDEFTIFLCNIRDEAIAKKEAGRLERFFKDFQAGEYVKYAATASIGAALFPRDGSDFESLYKSADKALYVAKKRGKNQLAFYEKDEAAVKTDN